MLQLPPQPMLHEQPLLPLPTVVDPLSHGRQGPSPTGLYVVGGQMVHPPPELTQVPPKPMPHVQDAAADGDVAPVPQLKQLGVKSPMFGLYVEALHATQPKVGEVQTLR